MCFSQLFYETVAVIILVDVETEEHIVFRVLDFQSTESRIETKLLVLASIPAYSHDYFLWQSTTHKQVWACLHLE